MCLLLADVREQGELARALHRDRDLALVAPAGAADAPRADLALLRDVAPQLVDVLVVDLVDLGLAEEAGLAAPRPARRGALPAPSLTAIGFRCWQSLSLERNVVVRALEVGVGAGGRACRDELVAAAAAGGVAVAAAAEELNGVGD